VAKLRHLNPSSETPRAKECKPQVLAAAGRRNV